ncbi:HNH endonuclease [Xanthobacter sp. YC-JY1]|uniref:HNH endonuclease signature motif containing protein n=1 Tax=Xanthobacter sp. YC-JY1 TaxID=2419844 RepID=UPI001F23B18A|nr:HNH endonuclease [Xanthobacter sp. YC-JY1]UJX47173.1 HNH endonuclease [Xanthobacter sp. YC-JY1]
MAVRPPRICSCGCGKVLRDGERCPARVARKKAAEQAADAARPTARERGYTTKWQKESKAFLAIPGHERCVHCGGVATLVDHKVAHKGDMKLFWSRSNWQPSCGRCNRAKAVREEGAFGRPVKAGVLA